MTADIYVALLRGINVGGKNIIRMSDLKACIEGLGCADVSTFIQSGNVLFRSTESDRRRLTETIEKALSRQFNYTARVVVASHGEMKKTVAGAPTDFGEEPAKYRYDVIFLREPLTAREAMKSVTVKEGVDTALPGKQVLYFSRLISKATQSRMAKLVGTPAYQYMTIRNWNTTVKIHDLMRRLDGGRTS